MAKKTKKKKEPIFNQRKRRVFRNVIPTGEVAFGVCFLFFVGVMAYWFFDKEDEFDPSERDISIEVLQASIVEDNLYRAPLQPWVEPGTQTAGGAPAMNLGIFPQQIVEGDWKPSSRLQEFDEGTLFEKINGAAPQYFSYGFNTLHYISVANAAADEEINIELYDMNAFRNALGIFAAQRGEGKEVREERDAYFYMTEAGAIGIYDKYFYKVAGNQSTETIRQKAEQIVMALTDIETDNSRSDPIFLAFRDTLGIPFEDIAFVKADVYQYDFAKDFWFANVNGDAEGKYYAHAAETEEDAVALYNELLENHLYDYEKVDETDNEVTLKHQFLDEYLVMYRDGAMIAGVDGAPSAESCSASLDQLLGALMYEQAEAA